MTPDFSQLIARLIDAGFEFVVIGGYAAVTHGSSQVTRDLGVCAVLTEESVNILRGALAEWNPRHRLTPQRLSFLTFPPPGEPLENIYLETDVGVVDILSSVLGVGDFERIKSRAEELEVGGRTVRVIALDDLIAAREAMGRDKDRMTALELRIIEEKRKRGGRQPSKQTPRTPVLRSPRSSESRGNASSPFVCPQSGEANVRSFKAILSRSSECPLGYPFSRR